MFDCNVITDVKCICQIFEYSRPASAVLEAPVVKKTVAFLFFMLLWTIGGLLSGLLFGVLGSAQVFAAIRPPVITQKDYKNKLTQMLQDWKKGLSRAESSDQIQKLDLVEQLLIFLHTEDLSVREETFIKTSLEKIRKSESSGESALRTNNALLAESALKLFSEPLEPGESALEILKKYVDASSPSQPEDPKKFVNSRAYVAGDKWEEADEGDALDTESDPGGLIDRRLIEVELGLIR